MAGNLTGSTTISILRYTVLRWATTTIINDFCKGETYNI